MTQLPKPRFTFSPAPRRPSPADRLLKRATGVSIHLNRCDDGDISVDVQFNAILADGDAADPTDNDERRQKEADALSLVRELVASFGRRNDDNDQNDNDRRAGEGGGVCV